jgi:hypothetical protein
MSYDPTVGRFISQDPIGFAGGDANTYRYVGNGPTDATDPSGLADGPRYVESDWIFSYYDDGSVNYRGGNWNPFNWGVNAYSALFGNPVQDAADKVLLFPRAADQSDLNAQSGKRRVYNPESLLSNEIAPGTLSSRAMFPGGDPSSEAINDGMKAVAVATAGSLGAACGMASPAGRFRPPGARHRLTKVGQKTLARDVTTVIEPGVDIAGDVAAINQGLAQRVGDRFIINGRTYGAHTNGTLYPISGPGFIQLDRGAFKGLGVLNKFGDTPQAAEIMGRMGLSPEAQAAARGAWRAGQQ